MHPRRHPSLSQWVLIFKNGAHICTCMNLAHVGLPCRHFFQAFVATSQLRYHITMVKSRWFKENFQYDSHLKDLPFLSGKENSIYANETQFDDGFMDTVTKHFEAQSQTQYSKPTEEDLTSTRIYGKIMATAAKIAKLVADQPRKGLETIDELESFCNKLDRDDDDSNKENRMIDLVKNPLHHKGKGAPKKKRIRSFVEGSVIKKRNPTKCGVCGAVEHTSKTHHKHVKTETINI